MMRPAPLSRHTGFTLLELLVALTLFGVIAVMLNQGLSLAVRSTVTGVAKTEQVQHLIAIQAFLRDKITNCKSVRLLPSRQISFIGQRDAIRFVSAAPEVVADSALFYYDVHFQEGSDANTLRVSLSAYPDDSRHDSSASLEAVELTDLRTFRLSYYGAQSAEHANVWHSTWANQSHLPLLVKVELTAASGLVWPPLIIRLRDSMLAQGK